MGLKNNLLITIGWKIFMNIKFFLYSRLDSYQEIIIDEIILTTLRAYVHAQVASICRNTTALQRCICEYSRL